MDFMKGGVERPNPNRLTNGTVDKRAFARPAARGRGTLVSGGAAKPERNSTQVATSADEQIDKTYSLS